MIDAIIVTLVLLILGAVSLRVGYGLGWLDAQMELALQPDPADRERIQARLREVRDMDVPVLTDADIRRIEREGRVTL